MSYKTSLDAKNDSKLRLFKRPQYDAINRCWYNNVDIVIEYQRSVRWHVHQINREEARVIGTALLTYAATGKLPKLETIAALSEENTHDGSS